MTRAKSDLGYYYCRRRPRIRLFRSDSMAREAMANGAVAVLAWGFLATVIFVFGWAFFDCTSKVPKDIPLVSTRDLPPQYAYPAR